MNLKHDIRPIIIHVLIPWNKVTLYCQIVPMCGRLRENLDQTIIELELHVVHTTSRNVKNRVGRKWMETTDIVLKTDVLSWIFSYW